MIPEIENALLDRIRAAHDNEILGYQLRKIDTYGGEFADGLEKAVSGRQFPFVLVAFAGATRLSHTNGRVKFSARWVAFCGANNLRNEAAARHGSGDKVGSYQIIEDVIGLVANQTFGLDIDPIIPQGVQPITNDKAGQQLVSVYGVELTTGFETQTSDIVDDLDDFETFHVNWDLPPHGNVDTSQGLPADDTADAIDTVALETEEEESEE